MYNRIYINHNDKQRYIDNIKLNYFNDRIEFFKRHYSVYNIINELSLPLELCNIICKYTDEYISAYVYFDKKYHSCPAYEVQVFIHEDNYTFEYILTFSEIENVIEIHAIYLYDSIIIQYGFTYAYLKIFNAFMKKYYNKDNYLLCSNHLTTNIQINKKSIYCEYEYMKKHYIHNIKIIDAKKLKNHIVILKILIDITLKTLNLFSYDPIHHSCFSSKDCKCS